MRWQKREIVDKIASFQMVKWGGVGGVLVPDRELFYDHEMNPSEQNPIFRIRNFERKSYEDLPCNEKSWTHLKNNVARTKYS